MESKLSKRWEFAQAHEKQVWDSMSSEDLTNHSKYYKKKAERLLKHLGKSEKSKTFLQIGCGPLDIINQIKGEKKYSIDPLADFYKSKFDFNYRETNFVKGVGEKLPYQDNFFDVVIFANVLDHTDNPEKVMREIKRVLKPNGILYIEAHFYQKSFIFISKIFGFFKKTFTGEIFNPCHPHMFQLKELKKIILEEFEIYQEKVGEDIEKEIKNLKELKKYLKKEKFTRKVPAMFGMLGIINYTCFCKLKS